MTYLGVLPNQIEKIIKEHCDLKIQAHTRRREDKLLAKDRSLQVRIYWKQVEKLARMKPITIQRVISAQLQKYKSEVKEKDEGRSRRKEQEEEEQ